MLNEYEYLSNVPKSETFDFTKITAATCCINNTIPVSLALILLPLNIAKTNSYYKTHFSF